jgi:kynurenine formamidase
VSATRPTVIDLTAPLSPQTVLWPGLPPVRAEGLFELESDGFYARVLTLPEHSGTHLDAPAHFVADGARVEQLPAERLVAPCAVLDVREQCAANPNFALERADLERLEARDGRVERGGAALLLTGWDAHAHSAAAWFGAEAPQRLSFPGFGSSAAELLIERGVVGIGIDTPGVDRGCDPTNPVHNMTLPAGLWHLEGLVNLADLPARGALLVVGALKLVEGSGTPARVLALV